MRVFAMILQVYATPRATHTNTVQYLERHIDEENERRNAIKPIEPKPNENPLETKKFITFKYIFHINVRIYARR